MTNTINDGGPAFPLPDFAHPSGQVESGTRGMSLRAYLAGQALAGLLANQYAYNGNHEDVAEQAVNYADAVIARLERP